MSGWPLDVAVHCHGYAKLQQSFSLSLHCKCLQGITGSLQGFPVVGKPCNIYRLQGNPIIIMGFPLQSVNITWFTHNIHRVSLYFLQPFSIAGKTCNLFFCFQGVFLKILSSCMVSMQERFLIKSRLWWHTYGTWILTSSLDFKLLIFE